MFGDNVCEFKIRNFGPVCRKISVPTKKFNSQLKIYRNLRNSLGDVHLYVIVINQLPRFVCSIEAQIPRAKPARGMSASVLHTKRGIG